MIGEVVEGNTRQGGADESNTNQGGVAGVDESNTNRGVAVAEQDDEFLKWCDGAHWQNPDNGVGGDGSVEVGGSDTSEVDKLRFEVSEFMKTCDERMEAIERSVAQLHGYGKRIEVIERSVAELHDRMPSYSMSSSSELSHVGGAPGLEISTSHDDVAPGLELSAGLVVSVAHMESEQST